MFRIDQSVVSEKRRIDFEEEGLINFEAPQARLTPRRHEARHHFSIRMPFFAPFSSFSALNVSKIIF